MSATEVDYKAKLQELKQDFLSRYEKTLVKKENVTNFKFSKVLGEGAFGVVVSCQTCAAGGASN